MKSPIPKIIHYCWFGLGPQSDESLRYIEGWRRLMPEYEIIEWNEDNFDIRTCPYVEEAYEARKFAFVSDYVRGHALYQMGGIYLDTDVEVLRSFDDLLKHRSFWGFEAGNYIATSTIGAIPKHEMLKAYLDQYRTRKFLGVDGTFDQTTNVQIITQLWEEIGVVRNDKRQIVSDDNLILPQCLLSPYDYTIGTTACVSETYAIHHYQKSWVSNWARLKGGVKKNIAALLGGEGVKVLQKLFFRKNITSSKK